MVECDISVSMMVKFIAGSIAVYKACTVIPDMEDMADTDTMKVLPNACQDKCQSYHVKAAAKPL